MSVIVAVVLAVVSLGRAKTVSHVTVMNSKIKQAIRLHQLTLLLGRMEKHANADPGGHHSMGGDVLQLFVLLIGQCLHTPKS